MSKSLEEVDRQHAVDSFWLFYGLQSLNGRNFDFIHILRICFVGSLSFRNDESRRGLCFQNYEN